VDRGVVEAILPAQFARATQASACGRGMICTLIDFICYFDKNNLLDRVIGQI